MAPGWWNKLKQKVKNGFNKVVDFGKKVWEKTKDVAGKAVDTVKPIYEKLKPIISTAGNVIETAFGVPGAGTMATTGIDMGMGVVDGIRNDSPEDLVRKLSGKIKLR
jgi:phage-related protein